MRTFLSITAGLLLIILLCTEEFRRAVAWAKTSLAQRPRLKPLAYPLAVLLALATGLIIVNALLKLIFSLTFSYE